MSKKIFFSFHHKGDGDRVTKIRNSSAVADYKKNPILDRTKWESIKRQGDHAVSDYIDKELKDSAVTVVLIGEQTANKRWVNYEIKKSIELKKGLLGIDVSRIEDKNGQITYDGPNPLPAGYPFYSWTKDNGEGNLGKWIEKAALTAGQ